MYHGSCKVCAVISLTAFGTKRRLKWFRKNMPKLRMDQILCDMWYYKLPDYVKLQEK